MPPHSKEAPPEEPAVQVKAFFETVGDDAGT